MLNKRGVMMLRKCLYPEYIGVKVLLSDVVPGW